MPRLCCHSCSLSALQRNIVMRDVTSLCTWKLCCFFSRFCCSFYRRGGSCGERGFRCFTTKRNSSSLPVSQGDNISQRTVFIKFNDVIHLASLSSTREYFLPRLIVKVGCCVGFSSDHAGTWPSIFSTAIIMSGLRVAVVDSLTPIVPTIFFPLFRYLMFFLIPTYPLIPPFSPAPLPLLLLCLTGTTIHIILPATTFFFFWYLMFFLLFCYPPPPPPLSSTSLLFLLSSTNTPTELLPQLSSVIRWFVPAIVSNNLFSDSL